VNPIAKKIHPRGLSGRRKAIRTEMDVMERARIQPPSARIVSQSTPFKREKITLPIPIATFTMLIQVAAQIKNFFFN
jgi:hypothetical protein